MSILNIPLYNQNPIIRQKTKEVADVKNSEIQQLILNMKETLRAHQGLGLAAPQVSKSLRIFVINDATSAQSKTVFINPKIKRKSLGKTCEEEGCLSAPGVYKSIKRSSSVTIEAFNEKGEKFKLKAKGLLARVFQHEHDHLEGILILDR